ncbi:type II toxin-antitoxin system RelE/ParE family toxin [Candidatus Peregrinibacteria bacterium CG10_big_fil_rev_8_21_14_0_10_49_10]|nr:MAG: type II toxin-antitoxin system RelE/ParE family toxin [Candidatus Peregrinibacteria bacterium CG10_big_fil_rev_8_21_14_0_10_49_10]
MDINFFDESTENFIAALDAVTIAKVLRTLDLLEEFGYKLGMPHSKNIDTNLFELRIRGKKEVRIMYCFHNNAIILLTACIKKSQKLPIRAVKLAKKRLHSLD